RRDLNANYSWEKEQFLEQFERDKANNQVFGAQQPRKPGDCPPRGGVYALRDPNSGDVMRTGRSKDLERRESEHGRDPRFEDFKFDPLYKTDDYSQQRGLEQMAHDQYQPPFNYVNPISPGNPNYMNYMNSAQQYLNTSR